MQYFACVVSHYQVERFYYSIQLSATQPTINEGEINDTQGMSKPLLSFFQELATHLLYKSKTKLRVIGRRKATGPP